MGERADLTRVDIRLAVTDSPYKDLPWFIRCREPGHSDSTHSLAVYDSHICCYGCGFRIDRRMDSLAYLLRVSVYDAIKRAPEFYGRVCERKPRATKRLSPSLAGVYQDLLWTGRRDRLDYLRGRGLTDTTIRNAMLGHDTTRFTIPVYDQAGKLVTIRFRRDDLYGKEWWDSARHTLRKVPKYSGLANYNGAVLYPRLAGPSHRHLYVTEGELDALRLRQEGYYAVTMTNGAGSITRILDLLPPWIDMIYIVGDQDAVGRPASRDLWVQASNRGYDVALASWDMDWGKDVTDLYLSGHTLEQVDWLVNGGMARRDRGNTTPTEFSNAS